MRVEFSLAGNSLRALTGGDDRARPGEARYYRMGEVAPAGVYTCTFCGRSIVLGSERVLSLCSSCDSTEFMVADPIHEPRLAA